MDKRKVGLVAGALVLVCVGMIFTVVYPFSTSVPAANTAEEHFSIEQLDELDEYTISGSYAILAVG